MYTTPAAAMPATLTPGQQLVVLTAEELAEVCDHMRTAELETDHIQRQRVLTCHGTRDMLLAESKAHVMIRLGVRIGGRVLEDEPLRPSECLAVLGAYLVPGCRRRANHLMLAQLYVRRTSRNLGLAAQLILGAAARTTAGLGLYEMGLCIGLRENHETVSYWVREWGFTADPHAPAHARCTLDETVALPKV